VEKIDGSVSIPVETACPVFGHGIITKLIDPSRPPGQVTRGKGKIVRRTIQGMPPVDNLFLRWHGFTGSR